MADELEQQSTGGEEIGLTDQTEVSDGGDSTTEAGGSEQEQSYDVNGEKVSLKQLQEGYLRTSDYTRKTQELARERDNLKPYVEMADYLKSNREKAIAIEKYLKGEQDGLGQDQFADPVQQKLSQIEYQTKQLFQTFGKMEMEKRMGEINSDPKFNGVFKDPTMEKVLLSYHQQIGMRGSLKDAAEEMFKTVTKFQVEAGKAKEQEVIKNLNSPTRKSSSPNNRTMNPPKDFNPARADEKSLFDEAMRMMS